MTVVTLRRYRLKNRSRTSEESHQPGCVKLLATANGFLSIMDPYAHITALIAADNGQGLIARIFLIPPSKTPWINKRRAWESRDEFLKRMTREINIGSRAALKNKLLWFGEIVTWVDIGKFSTGWCYIFDRRSFVWIKEMTRICIRPAAKNGRLNYDYVSSWWWADKYAFSEPSKNRPLRRKLSRCLMGTFTNQDRVQSSTCKWKLSVIKSGFYLHKKNPFELTEGETEEESDRQRWTDSWEGKKKNKIFLTDPIKYFFVQPPEPHQSLKAVVMRQLLLVPLKRYGRRHKRETAHGFADFSLKHADI